MSVSTTIKSIQDIMRKDTGVDGDAQHADDHSAILSRRSFPAKAEVPQKRDEAEIRR